MSKAPKIEVDYIFVKDVNFKIPEMVEHYGDFIKPNSLHKAIVVTPEKGEEFYIIPNFEDSSREGFVGDANASFYKRFAENDIIKVKSDEEISELPIEPEDFMKMSFWAEEPEEDFLRKVLASEVAGKLYKSIESTREDEKMAEEMKEEFGVDFEGDEEYGTEFDGVVKITPEDMTAQLTGLLHRNPEAFLNIYNLIQSI